MFQETAKFVLYSEEISLCCSDHCIAMIWHIRNCHIIIIIIIAIIIIIITIHIVAIDTTQLTP